ncbi:TMEM175 family protein [Sphingomonas bacterium]|uniref:TMEM175 family protein n=1 Tax=Sphingomonas bacterium TaxID=1895847 RepID=UPI001576EE70|nr:TMEM175 family protein [Sphingomonas bacterium]
MSRQHDQLERLTFFSDAVFAIAMTLLVVEVRLPHLAAESDRALGQALLDLIPNYIAFLVSFLVLARFWAGHHSLMGQLAVSSARLLRANVSLLLAVAFMPFPTAVISQHGELRVGIGFYAGWLLLLGVLNRRAVRVVADDPGLLAEDADPVAIREHLARSWIPIVIAIAAVALGMIAPLAGIVALVVGSPFVTPIIRRVARLGPRN